MSGYTAYTAKLVDGETEILVIFDEGVKVTNGERVELVGSVENTFMTVLNCCKITKRLSEKNNPPYSGWSTVKSAKMK